MHVSRPVGGVAPVKHGQGVFPVVLDCMTAVVPVVAVAVFAGFWSGNWLHLPFSCRCPG